jgi:hypothetical protein
MTRKDPLETAKAILEGTKSSEDKKNTKSEEAEMLSMKEAMTKKLSDNDASEEDIAAMMDKMETMSYTEMKEMMEKETTISDDDDEDDDVVEEEISDAETEKKTAKKAKVILDVDDAQDAEGKKGTDAADAKKVKKVKEDLEALFSGEELTEDFKEKAEIIFESAINMRVEALREEIDAESAAQLEESKEEFRNELSTKMDDYLSYVVEEWMKDNELSVERGLRGDIAESFMTNLKGLFEDHYITVPDDKYDLLEGLYDKVSGLETQLDGQIQKNTELNKDAMVSRCINVFNEVSEGLTDSENEKLKSLAEGLEYDSEDQFRDKLSVLRENYFNNVSETNELANEIVGDAIQTDGELEHIPVLDESMKFYSDMLTRSADVEKQTNFMG